MSWVQELYNTYENCYGKDSIVSMNGNKSNIPLLPQYHQIQKSTLEITIDSLGKFSNASLSVDRIIVPCTEESAARTGNDCPHSLCDKIQYCARDYGIYVNCWLDMLGELGISKEKIIKDYLKTKFKSYHESYCKQQEEWLKNSEKEPMLATISSFVNNENLIELLIKEGFIKDPFLEAINLTLNEEDFDKILNPEDSNSFFSKMSLVLNKKGYLLNEKLKKKIFFPKKRKLKESDNLFSSFIEHLVKEIVSLADLFIRWKVEFPGIEETRCWENKILMDSWVKYNINKEQEDSICMVSGKLKSIAKTHPKGIFDNASNAKLISANDTVGFTFRGRFIEDNQACTVSKDVSHKVHSALKWLISRQGFVNGSQVIVSWAVSGKETPDPLADSLSLFDETDEEKINQGTQISYTDAGQTFAQKLNKKIAGYTVDLKDSTKIVVMGLDSAGPGRLSITYYRELSNSEFLKRIEMWHAQMAWFFFLEIFQDMKDKKIKHSGHLIFAPNPKLIAEGCYGRKSVYDKSGKPTGLMNSTVERLLPCIIDGRQVPIDLVNSAVKRASNKIGLDHWEWERSLSVACALYRCYSIRNSNNSIKNQYTMALETERTDRDYLYGRLLAVAEHIEETALRIAKEPRETTATRLMQRFSDYPFQTWRNIESALVPYKSRLHANRPDILYKMKKLLDEIHEKFQSGDYEKEDRLTGAYLLGYHCQRLDLSPKKSNNDLEIKTENNNL